MHYKKLPGTEIEVPTICLGTMTWGQQNTEEQAHEQLDYAVEERGLKFIDTAEMYPVPPTPELQGTTERFIGTWLAKRGKRDDLILASKVTPSDMIRTRKIELNHDGSKSRLDRKSIREAIEGSFERLGVDYLDLYQVHFPERKANFFGTRGVIELEPNEDATPIEETLDAMTELMKEGKVRAIGVSNETAWGINEYLRIAKEKGLAHISTTQNQYSLTNRTYEIGLSEIGLRENVGLLAYSPLSMGVLSGKYLGGARPEGARFTLTNRNSARYNSPAAQPAVEAYVAIAKKHGIDPAAMAISFVASRPFVTSAIFGATTLDQLKINISAGELDLSPEIFAEIEEVYKAIPDPAA
jgi:aryl-alcohol dehydrogenase-like predicted oxidoreductase